MIKFKFGGINFSFGSSNGSRPQPGAVRGRYDAAATTHLNSRHWANADSLSADEANNPQVRQTIRDRYRYEAGSGAYLSGINDTYAEAVIGSGSRLEFLDKNSDVNKAVEMAFMDWFEGIKGPSKLLTMFSGSSGDGESFLKETSNINPRSLVQLDYELVEPELCTSEEFSNSPKNIDGVILGDNGKPIAYTFLKDHPGGQTSSISIDPENSITLRADQVIHFFKIKRAGQHRGISEFAPSLNVGANMRDFVLSTLDAARIASKYAGVLHTSSETTFEDEDSDGESSGFTEFENVSIENGMFLTLPEGYDMKQVSAEHPTTTFKEFKRELVAELARPIGMPVNVALGDSSGFNFASGRLDKLSWRKKVDIRQKDVVRDVLYPMFTKWFAEARLIDGLLPLEVVGPGYTPRFTWFFDGDGAVDPSKEATAREKNLKSKSTSLAEVWAEKGKDWRKGLTQISEEKKFMESLGLTEEEAQDQGEEAQAGRMREMIEEVFEEISQETK